MTTLNWLLFLNQTSSFKLNNSKGKYVGMNRVNKHSVSKTKVFGGKMLVLYRFPNDAETLGS